MNRLASSFLLSLAIIAAAAFPSMAQNQMEMQKGLSQLSAGQYAAALTAFESAVKKAPTDLQARYCYAVCLHHLGRLAEARTEYANVAKLSKNPDLTRRATKGMQGCGNPVVASAGGAQYQPPPPESTGEEGGAGGTLGRNPFNSQTVMHPAAWAREQQAAQEIQQALQQRGVNARVTAAPPQSKAPASFTSSGKPTVIDVYTDWCGWCKKLEPMLEQSKSRFGGSVEFRRINAESPENVEWCKSLGIHSYPTVIYMTADGKILDIGHGCPKTQQILDDRIAQRFNLPK